MQLYRFESVYFSQVFFAVGSIMRIDEDFVLKIDNLLVIVSK